MSPLMPAAFFADAATLPLPQSQEMSAPASETSPCCFSSKMVWTTRTKSCGRLAAGERREVVVEPLADLRVEAGRVLVLARRDEALSSTVPIQRSRMSPSAPRGHEAVPSSVITFR